jgi:xanthine/uracil/vitamin C permease (AzgA family)
MDLQLHEQNYAYFVALKMHHMLPCRYFKISERGSTIGTEIKAGVVTFLTMSYILLVNPQILGAAGRS